MPGTPIINELVNSNMMDSPNALPNIILSRYEANKKEGFVGIDTEGIVEILRAFHHYVITNDLDGIEYILNWKNGNNYDVTIHDNIFFTMINCLDGQQITMIFNNEHVDTSFLGFDADEPIKWLNGDMPYVEGGSNAKVILYKSNGIIYAEIQRNYIGGGGSGS